MALYSLFLILVSLVFANGDSLDFPLPFTRELRWTDSPGNLLSGKDVFFLQRLLPRCSVCNHGDNYQIGFFDYFTAADLAAFQKHYSLSSESGVLDALTATAILTHLSDDHYHYDSEFPNQTILSDPFLYLVQVPVHRDRSIETMAILKDRNLKVLHTFKVRTHGQPDRNQFSPSGSSPTGLYVLDYVSPEPDPKSFGIWNVHRLLYGIRGNAEMTCFMGGDLQMELFAREGLLMHTGEWPGWNSSQPMPNSHGCIHAHPEDLKLVDQLVEKIGVELRYNLFGKSWPYAFKPQGLFSIELVD